MSWPSGKRRLISRTGSSDWEDAHGDGGEGERTIDDVEAEVGSTAGDLSALWLYGLSDTWDVISGCVFEAISLLSRDSARGESVGAKNGLRSKCDVFISETT